MTIGKARFPLGFLRGRTIFSYNSSFSTISSCALVTRRLNGLFLTMFQGLISVGTIGYGSRYLALIRCTLPERPYLGNFRGRGLGRRFIIVRELTRLIIIVKSVYTILRICPDASVSLARRFTLTEILATSFDHSVDVSASYAIRSKRGLDLVTRSTGLSMEPGTVDALSFLPLRRTRPLSAWVSLYSGGYEAISLLDPNERGLEV